MKIRFEASDKKTRGVLIVKALSEAVAFAREFIRSGGSAIIYTRKNK